MDSSQLVNGVAVLLSFYVGYKYGLKVIKEKDEKGKEDKPAESVNKSVSKTELCFLFVTNHNYWYKITSHINNQLNK